MHFLLTEIGSLVLAQLLKFLSVIHWIRNGVPNPNTQCIPGAPRRKMFTKPFHLVRTLAMFHRSWLNYPYMDRLGVVDFATCMVDFYSKNEI